eukprot:3730340-Amphidinium_carterae.1
MGPACICATVPTEMVSKTSSAVNKAFAQRVQELLLRLANCLRPIAQASRLRIAVPSRAGLRVFARCANDMQPILPTKEERLVAESQNIS